MRYQVQYRYPPSRDWFNWRTTDRVGSNYDLPAGIYGRAPDGTFINEIEAAIWLREIRATPNMNRMGSFETRIIPVEID